MVQLNNVSPTYILANNIYHSRLNVTQLKTIHMQTVVPWLLGHVQVLLLAIR